MSILGGFVGGCLGYSASDVTQTLRAHTVNCDHGGDTNNIRVEVVSDATLFVQDVSRKVGKADIYQGACGDVVATIGYYRRDGDNAPNPPLSAVASDCRRTRGESLQALEGEFVAIFYSRSERTLHIINDRFAARPFYYTFWNGTLYFCSSLAFLVKLSRIPVDPDPLGCITVSACGHLVSGTTVLTNVSKLPPASHLVARGGQFVRKKYWKLERHVDQHLNADEHAQRTYSAFEEGTRWRCGLSDSGLIALSGGMDSRLLAAAASMHAHYSAFTFVDPGAAERTLETECASRVASTLGLHHEIRRLNIESLARDVKDVSLLVDGSVPIHHPLKTLSMIRASSDAGNFLMGGAPGGISAGSRIPGINYLDPEKVEVLAARFREDLIAPRSLLSGFLRTDVLNNWYTAIHEQVSDSLRSYEVSTAAEMVTLWSMDNRWPNFQFTSPIHNHMFIAEASPFLGYEYNECLLTVPPHWLYKSNFYFYMIYQLLPELRGINYANTGKPLEGVLHEYRLPRQHSGERPRSDIAYRAARCVRQQLTTLRSLFAGNTKAGSMIAPYAGHILRSESQLYDELRDILENSHPLGEIYDIQKCISQLDGFMQTGELGPMPRRSMDILGALISQACFFHEFS